MSLIDVKCEESFYLTNDCCYIKNEPHNLLLGHDCTNDYSIYLHFNLPPYYYLQNLKQARLLLFKLAFSNCQNQDAKYNICPLLDFLGFYYCTDSIPAIDNSRKVTFQDSDCSVYTEIDITSIVKSWIKEDIENKGLLISGNDCSHIIDYASSQYAIKGFRPMLRLIYDDNIYCEPLSTTPCDIDIDSP